MEITFVNHSGFQLDAGDVSLVCDPWLEGKVFNGGWSLLSPTWWPDFSKTTHIWFSHEHPDHFHPPSIKRIPEEHRPNITVLYQYTADGKVVAYCEKQGFRTQVLREGRTYELASGVSVRCGKMPTGDSWLLCDDGTTRLLNVNDCELKTEELAWAMRDTVGDIDVLFTQFSYAGWIGNIDEPLKRREASRRKVEDIVLQDRVLRPRHIVPFASFVWFSHRESFYMNDEINRIDAIYPELQERTAADVHVLYPGDRWTPTAGFDSAPALRRYAEDYAAALSRPELGESDPVPLDDLAEAADAYRKRMRRQNFLLPLWCRPVDVYLSDLDRAVRFSLTRGLQPVDRRAEDCDIILSSDSMLYWFRHDWGGATVYISGRMQAPDPQRYRDVYQYFYIGNMNNRGQSYPWTEIKRRLKRRIDHWHGRRAKLREHQGSILRKT